MTNRHHVAVNGDVILGNDLPLVLIAGPCQMESRDLQHIDRLSGNGALFLGMNIGEDGKLQLIPDLGENGQRLFQADATLTGQTGASGLVEA